jgi:hypothetical protein
MRTVLHAIAAASVFLAGAGIASAQSSETSTTTWTNDEGTAIREYSTTRHYSSFNDPALQTSVGVVVPQSVTLYPLPETMHVQEPDRYSYTIINDRPVVVERTTRQVVHSWPQ